jgi:hypothetical protein
VNSEIFLKTYGEGGWLSSCDVKIYFRDFYVEGMPASDIHEIFDLGYVYMMIFIS